MSKPKKFNKNSNSNNSPSMTLRILDEKVLIWG